MAYAKKIDGNQNDIVKQLRQIPGVTVLILSMVGNGCPDFAVGYKARTYLIELKDGYLSPSQKKLTEDEQKFFDNWTGHVSKCETLEEILKVIGVNK